MRMTPWESVPRRLAHTSTSAHGRARSGATPAAVKIAAANCSRSALGMVIGSVIGGQGYRVDFVLMESRRCHRPRKDAGETFGISTCRNPFASPRKARGMPARGAGQEGATAVSHVLRCDYVFHCRGDPPLIAFGDLSSPLAGEGKSPSGDSFTCSKAGDPVAPGAAENWVPRFRGK